MRTIMDETIAAADADGTAVSNAARVSADVIESIIDTHSRTGRQAGAGFYDYVDGKRELLWPGLRAQYADADVPEVPFEDLIDRFLFIQALETQ